MFDYHPDRGTLERFMRGDLPVGENREVVQHLLRGCRRCRDLSTDLWPQVRRPEAADFSDSFARVVERVEEQRKRLDGERAQAPELLESLRDQPAARQLLLIRNSRRYRTWALCELALEQSRELGFREPGEAVEIAELALAIAQRLEPGRYGASLVHDLQARAWSVLANARRISSDLHGAERAFRIAESLLADGTGDPLEEARILAMKAVLRSDQRRFDEAAGILDRVIAIYRRTGERQALAQTLIRKGTALGEAGHTEDAIAYLQQGAAVIDPERDRRWSLVARHNLILYMSELGRVAEAVELLEETRPLYLTLGESMNLLRLRWLEGRLATAQGHLDAAEDSLIEVRDAFVERSMGYDAALATLDLATVYLQQGRTTSIRTMVGEMLPVFESLRVHRETIAALMVLGRAVDLERITAQLIREVSGFIEKSRHDPSLRFRASV